MNNPNADRRPTPPCRSRARDSLRVDRRLDAALPQLPRPHRGAGQQPADLRRRRWPNQNTGTIGGYIKIEKQDAGGRLDRRHDGDPESRHRGTELGRHRSAATRRPTRCSASSGCATTAVARRHACTYNNSQNSWDWWPQALYDAREGSFRDSAAVRGHDQTSPMVMGGRDALHRARRRQPEALVGRHDRHHRYHRARTTTATSSTSPIAAGITTRPAADVETGEYGFEDSVNSTSATGPARRRAAGRRGRQCRRSTVARRVAADVRRHAVERPGQHSDGAVAPYMLRGRSASDDHSDRQHVAPAPGAGQARVNKALAVPAGAEARERRHRRRRQQPADGGSDRRRRESRVRARQLQRDRDRHPTPTWTNQEPNVPAAIIADADHAAVAELERRTVVRGCRNTCSGRDGARRPLPVRRHRGQGPLVPLLRRGRAATRDTSSAPTAARPTSCGCSRTGAATRRAYYRGLDCLAPHQPAGGRHLQVRVSEQPHLQRRRRATSRSTSTS